MNNHPVKQYLINKAIKQGGASAVKRGLAQPTLGIRLTHGNVSITTPKTPQESVLNFYIDSNVTNPVYTLDTAHNNLAVTLQADILRVDGKGAVDRNKGMPARLSYTINFPLFYETFKFFGIDKTIQQYGILNLVARALQRKTPIARIPMTDNNRNVLRDMLNPYPAIREALTINLAPTDDFGTDEDLIMDDSENRVLQNRVPQPIPATIQNPDNPRVKRLYN